MWHLHGGRQGGGRRGGGGRRRRGRADPNAIHIFIWSGPKTHPEGLHDYPQLLADWSKDHGDGLMMRGAIVDGALHPPTAADLANIDVVVMYKGDAEVTMTPQQHADLEAYIKRGGGFVSIHDSLCVSDTDWWANTVTGGAKKHGERNFSAGMLHTTIVDTANPLMAGMKDCDMQRRGVHADDVGEDADPPAGDRGHARRLPQGRGRPADLDVRAHAARRPAGARVRVHAGTRLQGPINPNIYPMLQRGIAWAAKKPLDALATVRGTGGGRGIGGSDIVVPPGGAGRGRGRGGN